MHLRKREISKNKLERSLKNVRRKIFDQCQIVHPEFWGFYLPASFSSYWFQNRTIPRQATWLLTSTSIHMETQISLHFFPTATSTSPPILHPTTMRCFNSQYLGFRHKPQLKLFQDSFNWNFQSIVALSFWRKNSFQVGRRKLFSHFKLGQIIKMLKDYSLKLLELK